MDNKAFFKIGYGLYVLTAREMGKDNGCIINTLTQVTGSPCRVTIAVNKENYTCGMIDRTGLFNVSILTERTSFALFQQFGFHSGKDADKTGGHDYPRGENTLIYVPDSANAYLACRVVSTTDLGSHLLFLADVTNAEVLNNDESVTYAYYQKHIKPAPAKTTKKGWRCPICGYEYEGDELPPDFVCPICKHGGAEFVRIGGEARTK